MAEWSPDALGRDVFGLLLPLLSERIDVLLDDTRCQRSGPRILGFSMHHDGVASTCGRGGSKAHRRLARGDSWVVLAVRVPLPWSENGMAVPVRSRLDRSPKRCSKKEYRKRTVLAREMLHVPAEWLPDGRILNSAVRFRVEPRYPW